MWSLGALLYRIIVGRPPFYVEGEQPNQTKQRILTGKFEIPKAALDQCPTLCDIIRLLLVVNPEERLTCEDLLIMYPEYAIVPIDMDTTD
jgi:serine/threonine protein kinase